MTDARIRILTPLLAAAFGLAAAGCATTPAPVETSEPVEETVNIPSEVPFPDEAEAPETPPEELEALAPEVAPLASGPAYGDVIVRIRSQLSLPQVDHPRVDREIEWLQRNPDYLARVFGRAQR